MAEFREIPETGGVIVGQDHTNLIMAFRKENGNTLFRRMATQIDRSKAMHTLQQLNQD